MWLLQSPRQMTLTYTLSEIMAWIYLYVLINVIFRTFPIYSGTILGLHMGPNNLCYVTRHFLFSPMSPCHFL